MPQSSTQGTPQKHYLMRLLLDAYSWFDESLQHSMQVSGVPVLSRSQSMVMVYIGEGVRRPSALARRLRVSRQAMHKSLGELEQKGFLQLVPDPADRRAKIVRLSPTGLKHHRKALACLNRLEEELEARIGPRMVAALSSALQAQWGQWPVEARIGD